MRTITLSILLILLFTFNLFLFQTNFICSNETNSDSIDKALNKKISISITQARVKDVIKLSHRQFTIPISFIEAPFVTEKLLLMKTIYQLNH